MTEQRVEHDAKGDVTVSADRHWGAQTQRALLNFAISTERMTTEFLRALALTKRAAAVVTEALGPMNTAKASTIVAADEVCAGQHDAEFPLPVLQTGSGTQTHMNMNTVLTNLASVRLGGSLGKQRLVRANDDVNRGQLSNDVVPTVLNCGRCGGVAP